jgi:hypothetical protein
MSQKVELHDGVAKWVFSGLHHLARRCHRNALWCLVLRELSPTQDRLTSPSSLA